MKGLLGTKRNKMVSHEGLVDKMHALDFRLAIIYLQNDRDSFLISLFATNFN